MIPRIAVFCLTKSLTTQIFTYTNILRIGVIAKHHIEKVKSTKSDFWNPKHKLLFRRQALEFVSTYAHSSEMQSSQKVVHPSPTCNAAGSILQASDTKVLRSYYNVKQR